MSEERNEGGSVLLPTGVAVGAGYLTHRQYKKGANTLVSDAFIGKEGVAPELIKAARTADIAAAENLTSAKFLQEEGRIAKLTGATVERATKGFNVTFNHPEEAVSTITGIDKLPDDVSKLLPEGTNRLPLEGDALKKLTDGAEKSWVAKTAKQTEQGAAKTIRGTEAWKEAGGGIKATFGHMTTGGKALVAGSAVIAGVSAAMAIKNMFGGPSASRIEAERNAQIDTVPAR